MPDVRITQLLWSHIRQPEINLQAYASGEVALSCGYVSSGHVKHSSNGYFSKAQVRVCNPFQ